MSAYLLTYEYNTDRRERNTYYRNRWKDDNTDLVGTVTSKHQFLQTSAGKCTVGGESQTRLILDRRRQSYHRKSSPTDYKWSGYGEQQGDGSGKATPGRNDHPSPLQSGKSKCLIGDVQP